MTFDSGRSRDEDRTGVVHQDHQQRFAKTEGACWVSREQTAPA